MGDFLYCTREQKTHLSDQIMQSFTAAKTPLSGLTTKGETTIPSQGKSKTIWKNLSIHFGNFNSRQKLKKIIQPKSKIIPNSQVKN
jgi:hypothetical protein